MSRTRPLRILHLPVDLAGHARALAAAQRVLGHDAISVSLAHSPYGFNGDECHDAPIGTPGRLRRRELARWRLLWRSLTWADVIHCHFGQTILSVRALPVRDPERSGLAENLTTAYARLVWLKDLGLWRLAGKRVAMSYYGDDVRLVSRALERAPFTHLAEPRLRAALERLDPWKRRLVSRLAGAGVVMLAVNPDLMDVLPPQASFLPYGHVDPALVSVVPVRREGPLRLAHMPTDRDVKGTPAILAAVARLQAEGLPLELTLVEGKTNAEALAILSGQDVLIDQLRVGWYGGVAVEAMAMGKPVIAHLNPADLALAPPAMVADLPIITATPDSIAPVLRELVSTPRDALVARGLAGRRFVEQWHDPLVVARQALAAYGL